MSDFTLEISDVTTTLEIETSTEDNTENLENGFFFYSFVVSSQ